MAWNQGDKWYARQDSNLRPLVPETNALSMLSYGRMVDSKGLIESADSSNWLTVPELCPKSHPGIPRLRLGTV